MRQIFLCLLLIFSPLALANQADRLKEANFAAQWRTGSEQLERKSQTVLNYLWVDVYAAALFTPPDVSPKDAVNQQRGQRLELYYFRDIDRSDVIKAASQTLQRQQSPATLSRLQGELDRLHASFQNIRPGDRYALDYLPGRGMNLERNGQVIFSSPNAELARVYLGIWLAPEGLSDSLRTALLKM
jgi:hypothetical protein